jgi:hypothetical protein
MKREWWFAASIAAVAIMLSIEGYMAIWGIEATSYFLSSPGGAFATPDQIESARRLQPLLYAVVVEGVLFGAAAVVLALAVLRHKRWAHRGVLFASMGLAAMASVIIALAPHLWDEQGVFIGLCACYWWAWYAKRKALSAL